MEKKPILKVEGLGVSFSQYTRGLRRSEMRAITNLDIDLYEGEILAVVGSSGSGKSLLAHAILGILPENAVAEGRIYYRDRLLTEKDRKHLRGREIVLIPQSVNYLDPLMKVKKQIGISLRDAELLQKGSSHHKEGLIRSILNRYGLGDEVEEYYPHQLSGGMARKVLLSTALASDSRVVIADEPTPGLDARALDEALKDFRELADSNKAVLMITHDINAALRIADRISIFYAGSTLETAGAGDFEGNGESLRHPYTRALLHALPDREFRAVEGSQPLPGEVPSGCSFYERCGRRREHCRKAVPEWRELRGGKVRCHDAT
ncbi:peptide/nickel transport system ATP-binding protein [Anaerotaenia torta]|uniref:ABC transporter ATP-binding protein n=1 Tax=Anaerotaenia torta TaxID=433293 RepID=UPI003D195715